MTKRLKLLLLKNQKYKLLLPFFSEMFFWLKKIKNNQALPVLDSSMEGLLFKLERAEKNLKINFVTGYGLGTHYLKLEPVLIKTLIARGHSVTSLICGKAIGCCEFNADCGENSSDVPFKFRRGVTLNARSDFGQKCVRNVERAYEKLGIEQRSLNGVYVLSNEHMRAVKEVTELLSMSSFSELREFKYREVAVGEEAFASTLRASFMGDVSHRLGNVALFLEMLKSAMKLVDIYYQEFTDNKPDRVVLIHGIYLTHGIPTKVATKLGIPVIVLGGGGIRKNTLIGSHQETYHKSLVNESNSSWEGIQLTEEERSRVINYATQKRNNGNAVDYVSYHPNPNSNLQQIEKELSCSFEKFDKIVTLYTNVLWDGQILYESNAYNGVVEWVIDTAEIARNSPETLFIVRIHPAEVKTANPSLQPIKDELDRELKGKYPDNFKIVTPFSDIDSYTLAQLSDVNVIYGTKMGLEIALLKKYLIVVGESFSRNKGYGTDVSTPQEYREALNTILSDEEISTRYEKALKYANYFYFRRMLDIPSDNELKSGKLKGLSTILDGIELETEFVGPR
ncbi:hypothetical protein [Litoribacillus peritrichatus]|uniref:Capsule polysaccharide biosynthesis protein n=1 Tax=Litoribacillus peritrichatus TaxID=718191 RepID=A0ABP7LZS1_9GAMM